VNDRFQSRFLLALCSVYLVAGSPAYAQRPVADRLVEQGGLSAGQARVLIKSVSKRMKRAAAPHNRTDVLRVTVARALHEPRAASKRGGGRVVARLRAGLDEWALEHLFAPTAPAMANCERQFRLSSNLCESLAAASRPSSGREHARAADAAAIPAVDPRAARMGVDTLVPVPTSDRAIDRQATETGKRVAAPQRAPTARERAAQTRARAAEERRAVIERRREAIAAKREGVRQARLAALQHKRDLQAARVDAKREQLDAQRAKRAEALAAREQREQDRRDAIARKQEQIAAARAKVVREREEAVQRKREAAERVERERREAIEREHGRVEVARRKAEYQKQRAAYLDRQREQMAARKERVVATVAGEKVERGPTSQLEAQLIGLAPEAAPNGARAEASRGKAGKNKTGSNSSAAAHEQPAAALPNGLEMVDALVADPSAKSVAHR
jgi:hypothetical protein